MGEIVVASEKKNQIFLPADSNNDFCVDNKQFMWLYGGKSKSDKDA